MTGRRAPRFAVVPPLAALVVIDRLGPTLARMVRDLEVLGQVQTAEQLRAGLEQLEESARQLRSAGGASACGTAEVPEASGAAGSEVPPNSSVVTRAVARQLGTTERQVRNLIRNGRLLATKVGGRWLVDEVSLADEIERRSAEK